jgi:formylglycine-generating enzyme required for sulfatase activity
MRLPTEKEWEFAARGGLVNQSYPWGTEFEQNKMNIWDGKFPNENTMSDGYLGLAPVESYDANKYGLYNMVGNVWEWVLGGKADKRILRGGSFVDSKFGEHNHAVMVSTKQTNSGDSAGNNVGFRCVKTIKEVKINSDKKNIENVDNIDLEL